MLKAFRKLWNDERGNALIIVAASLPLIMGSVGLASDTIQWTLWKRELQRAADSAAIAGVYAKVQSVSHEAAVARDLEHNNNVNSFTIDTDIENSPATGAFTADPMAVRVLLAAQKRLNFSSMFMLTPPTIRAAATATIVPTGDYCVISLESTATTGISVGGTANVDLGCGMITNSTSMDAAVAFGSSDVEASPIAAVGGIDATGNWADNVQLLPFTLAQADPFASIEPPVPSGSCPNVVVNSNQTETLDPGCYGSMALRGNVTLNAGEYVIDGGNLTVGAQAVISCNGCVFILTSRTASTNPTSIGSVTVNAGARLNLTAPTTGDYAGILMYQDRRAPTSTSSNYQNHINGNSQSSFQGAFYFPNQQTTFNGTAGMSTACMQLVARRVIFSGTASISNTCPAGSGSQSFAGRSVRLVE